MAEVTFTIDFPIVPKGRPRKGRYGNFYTPKETADCEKQIQIIARGACRRGRNSTFQGPVALLLDLAAHRGDLDNRIKTVSDALNKILYKDDRQIKRIVAAEVEGTRSTITVKELIDAGNKRHDIGCSPDSNPRAIGRRTTRRTR
jgi:crossover junction endodeoxyribonuclease RusA